MRAQWTNTGPFLVGGKINLPWDIIIYNLAARLFTYTTNIRKLKRNKSLFEHHYLHKLEFESQKILALVIVGA